MDIARGTVHKEDRVSGIHGRGALLAFENSSFTQSSLQPIVHEFSKRTDDEWLKDLAPKVRRDGPGSGEVPALFFELHDPGSATLRLDLHASQGTKMVDSLPERNVLEVEVNGSFRGSFDIELEGLRGLSGCGADPIVFIEGEVECSLQTALFGGNAVQVKATELGDGVSGLLPFPARSGAPW
jgi:hypothetical protein